MRSCARNALPTPKHTQAYIRDAAQARAKGTIRSSPCTPTTRLHKTSSIQERRNTQLTSTAGCTSHAIVCATRSRGSRADRRHGRGHSRSHSRRQRIAAKCLTAVGRIAATAATLRTRVLVASTAMGAKHTARKVALCRVRTSRERRQSMRATSYVQCWRYQGYGEVCGSLVDEDSYEPVRGLS